jgi:hypothetical protein
MITVGPYGFMPRALRSSFSPIRLSVVSWTTEPVTGTGDQGLIPESEPEKRLTLPRKAAGAKITQCEDREVVTKNNKISRVSRPIIGMR